MRRNSLGAAHGFVASAHTVGPSALTELCNATPCSRGRPLGSIPPSLTAPYRTRHDHAAARSHEVHTPYEQLHDTAMGQAPLLPPEPPPEPPPHPPPQPPLLPPAAEVAEPRTPPDTAPDTTPEDVPEEARDGPQVEARAEPPVDMRAEPLETAGGSVQPPAVDVAAVRLNESSPVKRPNSELRALEGMMASLRHDVGSQGGAEQGHAHEL